MKWDYSGRMGKKLKTKKIDKASTKWKKEKDTKRYSRRWGSGELKG